MAYALQYEGKGYAASRAAGAQEQHLAASRVEAAGVAQRPQKARPVSIVPAEPPAPVDDGVDRASGGGRVVELVQVRDHRLFVGHGDVDAQRLRVSKPLDKLRHVAGGHFPGLIGGVDV